MKLVSKILSIFHYRRLWHRVCWILIFVRNVFLPCLCNLSRDLYSENGASTLLWNTGITYQATISHNQEGLKYIFIVAKISSLSQLNNNSWNWYVPYPWTKELRTMKHNISWLDVANSVAVATNAYITCWFLAMKAGVQTRPVHLFCFVHQSLIVIDVQVTRVYLSAGKFHLLKLTNTIILLL